MSRHRSILQPFLITRTALLCIGLAAQAWPINPLYPSEVIRERGWQFTPWLWLDMWARFDAGWFMSIVYEGYWWGKDLNVDFSNVAFFPLYPGLVSVLLWLVPGALDTPQLRPQWFALAGVIISNAMLLGALALWRALLLELNLDAATRTRAIWLFVLSPFAFFFSTAYSESTFVCMALASLLLALRGRWGWAGVFGALAALARPPGILLLLPLLGMAVLSGREATLHHRGTVTPRFIEKFSVSLRLCGDRVRATISLWLPLMLIPIAWLAFLAFLYPRTGHVLSPYTAHNAWEEYYTPPWFTLLGFFSTRYALEPIDRAVLVLTIFGGGVLIDQGLRARDTKAQALQMLGAFTLLVAIAPLWSGTLVSIGRYCLSAFPAVLGLALLLRGRLAFALACAACAVAQAVLWVAWVRFYDVL